jgi:hypothetical protein
MRMTWMLLQIACIALFLALAVRTIVNVHRRSHLLGGLLIAGTILHAAVAALLFGISWLDMPLLRGLHTGDGFWTLAPDARIYFDTAAKASEHGLHMIPYGSASPTFVGTIAVWMDLIGVNPASPLFFNLIAFVVTCGLIVRFGLAGDDNSPPAAAVWPLATLSFSPTLLFCSGQVLKDLMFACLVALVALSARELLTRLDRQPLKASALALAGGVIALVTGVYFIAGIRAYYAVFIWMALAVTLALFVFRQPRAHLKRYLGVAAAALTTIWIAFMLGAGPYYSYYHHVAVGSFNSLTGGVMSKALDRLSKLKVPGSSDGAAASANIGTTTAVDNLREGFVLSAGQTNLIRRPPAATKSDAKPGEKEAEDLGPSRFERIMERVYGVTMGLLAMFVPISLLQALSIVDIQGGRGFLFIADLDTLFIDASVFGVIWLLYRQRQALRHRQVYLVFCLVVAILSAVLLAYVVTNLGTLFRLRLIALVPFWMAPLAISRVAVAAAVTQDAAVTRERTDPALSPV